MLGFIGNHQGNRNEKIVSLAALTICVSLAANAQNLRDATVAFKKGDWKVLRDTNPMTDKTDCTGIYKDDYGIQLTKDRLYIDVRGGIDSVTLRFDDDPPSRLRLATDMEKKIRSIIISGSDFDRLIQSKRLRYQSGTLVNGIQSGEIDLTDFQPALASIAQGCPVTAPTESASVKAASTKSSSCNVALIKRMKDQGLKPEQILAICQ